MYTILALNGAAGKLEFQVEIGQEFTGQGMTLLPRLPPQQGFSAQAYLNPVILKWAEQFWHHSPGLSDSGGGQSRWIPDGDGGGGGDGDGDGGGGDGGEIVVMMVVPVCGSNPRPHPRVWTRVRWW